jgi:hypothetical protein
MGTYGDGGANGTPGGGNPFLSSIPPHGDASQAPRSLLPPPPTPPPGLGRTLPPIPKFTPPTQKTPSTAPPLALAGTLPPVVERTNLMSEIASRTLQRRGKNIAIAAVAAMVLIVGIKVIGSSSSASTQEATGIRVSSKQNGVKLLVDGKLIGMLPQELKGMTPGEHAIVFDAGDRYAQQRSTVVLVPGEMKELEPIALKVTRGSAIFDVRTPGTQLALVSSDERRELTDYSHAVDVDNTKTWTLEATKSGYKPVALPIVFDERAERTFTVQLSESGGVDILALPAANVTVTEETPVAAALPTTKAKKRKERAERGEASPRLVQPAPAPMVAAPTAGAAASGTCSLNINTIPSSHVTLDGRNLGTTPRLAVMVSSGSHNIVFSTENARKSTITSCRPGETKTVAIRMPE